VACASGVRGIAENDPAFAVRHRDRHHRARHVGEEQRGRVQHLDQREARLELLRQVALEARPGGGTGNQVVQLAHHLAAVAHAQRKGVGAFEEGRELVARTRVEQDRLGPAAARPQHVAVAEAAARGEPGEVGEADPAGQDVAHVDVDRGKAGGVERGGHLDLAVDALLAQHRDARALAGRNEGRGDIGIDIEARRVAQAGIAGVGVLGELLLGARRVVAQLRHFVAGARPGALQLGARLVENHLVAAQHAHAVARIGLADDIEFAAQAGIDEGLHHCLACRCDAPAAARRLPR
jgi:hypothetical protein